MKEQAAMDPIAGITVELEDHGQDFLEFDIREGRIVETRPFQGWMWDGFEVLNETVCVGNRLSIRKNFVSPTMSINYPVVAVRPLSHVQEAS